MSIVPISCLSASDLAILGNNLRQAARRRKPARKCEDVLAAVNRSLAVVDEQVARLHRRTRPAQCSRQPVAVQ